MGIWSQVITPSPFREREDSPRKDWVREWPTWWGLIWWYPQKFARRAKIGSKPDKTWALFIKVRREDYLPFVPFLKSP